MKKKLIAVLLIAALALTFAFASGKQETSSGAALGSEPVTITFWHCASDEDGVLMDKYIKEFNETNEYQITVNAIYQGQYSDATTLMKTILSAENYSELPDIMQLDASGKVDYLNSGKAFTIDDAQAEFGEEILNLYTDGALSNWNIGGVQLGLPYATSTTITFYNADLLKKAGWDRCPETFAEIAQLAQDMKKAGITDAVAFGTVPNTPTLANWIGQLGSYVLDNSNGADGSAKKLVCVDNGALKTFLTEWKAMYDNGAGYVVNQSLSSSAFIGGQVAIYTSSSSNIKSINDKVAGAFEVGTAKFIKVNDSASFGASASGSCLAMFDSGDSLKKAATWEFIQYLTGAEVQADHSANTGYTPGCKAAEETAIWKEYLATTPQAAAVTEQFAETPAMMRSITVGPSADFYYGVMNGCSDMLTKNMSVDDALNAMATNLQSIVDNYWRNNQ